MHKIITITGLDRVGKETQSRLLTEVLTPSVRMSAPDYNHWAGTIVSSILHRKPFYIATSVEQFPEGAKVDEGKFIRTEVYNQGKHPQILQLLHTINTYDKQPLIRAGLKSHHWVMDRYIEDALAYGSVDGCSLDFLIELNRNFIQSDLVVVIVGSPYPRPGETPDMNESDSTFQNMVWNKYVGLTALFPHWNLVDLRTKGLNPGLKWQNIQAVHKHICGLVTDKLGLEVTPLAVTEVMNTVQSWGK